MQWSDVVTRPSVKILRQFAGLCLIVFGTVGAVSLWRGRATTIVIGLAVSGAAVGLVGLVRPAAIRWVYSGWMIAVFPIGWTVSRLMLAALFYLVFAPVALVFRLMRRDALHLRQEDAATEWAPKPGVTSADQYFRQF